MATNQIGSSKNEKEELKIMSFSSKARDSEVIKLKVSSNGTLILPNNAPQDVKDWVENG